MSVALARLFALGRNDFRRRTVRPQPPHRRGFHFHHGRADHVRRKPCVGPEKLGHIVDGLPVVLHRRLRQRIRLRFDFHPFLPETDFESQIDAVRHLPTGTRGNPDRHRFLLKIKPADRECQIALDPLFFLWNKFNKDSSLYGKITKMEKRGKSGWSILLALCRLEVNWRN